MNVKWGKAEDLGALGHLHENRAQTLTHVHKGILQGQPLVQQCSCQGLAHARAQSRVMVGTDWGLTRTHIPEHQPLPHMLCTCSSIVQGCLFNFLQLSPLQQKPPCSEGATECWKCNTTERGDREPHFPWKIQLTHLEREAAYCMCFIMERKCLLKSKIKKLVER